MEKNNKTLNLNNPVKTLLPKKVPTINLEYDYYQKGIDLSKINIKFSFFNCKTIL